MSGLSFGPISFAPISGTPASGVAVGQPYDDDFCLFIGSDDDTLDDLVEIVQFDSRGGVTNVNKAQLPDSTIEPYPFFDEPYEIDVEWQHDSSGVGPNLPPNPLVAPQPEHEWLFFDEPYEDQLEGVDDSQPVVASGVSNPLITVEDVWQDDELQDDDYWFVEDVQAISVASSSTLNVEDTWDWEDQVEDELFLDEQLQSIAIVQPVDFEWDWDEHVEDEYEYGERYGAFNAYTDVRNEDWDWSEDVEDDAPIDQQIVASNSPMGADDQYWYDEYSEDDWWTDEKPSANLFIPPSQFLDDSWDWHENAEDELADYPELLQPIIVVYGSGAIATSVVLDVFAYAVWLDVFAQSIVLDVQAQTAHVDVFANAVVSDVFAFTSTLSVPVVQ